jgi:hypothetical protein
MESQASNLKEYYGVKQFNLSPKRLVLGILELNGNCRG